MQDINPENVNNTNNNIIIKNTFEQYELVSLFSQQIKTENSTALLLKDSKIALDQAVSGHLTRADLQSSVIKTLFPQILKGQVQAGIK